MTKDEALKLAKECGATTYTNRHYPDATAVTFSPLAWEKFCEQALAAQPAHVQEPVAWMHTSGHIQMFHPHWEQVVLDGYTREKGWTPLYTTPPTQPAVQEPVGSMGMPLSCGKPLCAPGDHHPLCKLATPPAAQPAVQEPYAWHYKNAAGVSAWHFGPSRMFDADLEASKMWPRTHQLIPVYTENKRLSSDCEELAALGWQAITCPSCGNVGARGYPRNTTSPAAPIPDAITDNSESPEYRTGWNDYRQAMMEMMK